MNSIHIAWLLILLWLTGCAELTGPPAATPDDPALLREELRLAEAEKLRLRQQLAELQHRSEEEKQKLQAQLAERQRLLREEQRKVEELEAKIAAIEKKMETLRRIDREALRRAISR